MAYFLNCPNCNQSIVTENQTKFGEHIKCPNNNCKEYFEYLPPVEIQNLTYLRLLEEIPSIIPNELTIGALTLIYGPPACGKTYYALHYSQVSKVKKVLFIDTENGPYLFKLRTQDMQLPDDKLRFIFDPVKLDNPFYIKAIEHAINKETEPYDVVVIDTLRRGFTGDENESQAVSNFFEHTRRLAREKQVAIVILHHCKKTSKETSSAMDLARGSSDIIAAVDYAYYLHPSDDGNSVLECVKNRWGIPPSPQRVSLVTYEGKVVGIEVGSVSETLSHKEKELLYELAKIPPMDTLALSFKQIREAAEGLENGGKPPALRTIRYWVAKLVKHGYLGNDEGTYSLRREAIPPTNESQVFDKTGKDFQKHL